jgi:NlpC/P60 family putative phage cell wall peptidase
MALDEAHQRAAVVAEARTWLGTPYHHEARVKGAGVDCAQLLIGVYAAVGLIKPPKIAHYPPDWHLHRSAERYLAIVLDHARELDAAAEAPGAGDVVLWRFGRCFSHGAIVVAWPVVIHAYLGRPVVLEDAVAASWLDTIGERSGAGAKKRPRRFFSYWRPDAGASRADGGEAR